MLHFPETQLTAQGCILPLSGSHIFPSSDSMPPSPRAHLILKHTCLNLSSPALSYPALPSWVLSHFKTQFLYLL